MSTLMSTILICTSTYIHKLTTIVRTLYSTGAKMKQQYAECYGAEALVLQDKPESSEDNSVLDN